MFGEVDEVACDEPEIGHDGWLEPESSLSTLGKALVELAV